MGEQSGTGPAADNWATRCRRLDDRVAASAGKLGANVANHPEVVGHVLEHFAHVLTEPLQRAAAVRAAARLRRMLELLARQVHRQRLACGAFGFGTGSDRGNGDGALGAHPLKLFERKFQLANGLVELLRAAAELRPAQLRNDEVQALDLGLLRRDHRLEQRSVVGQGRDRVHDASLRESGRCEQPLGDPPMRRIRAASCAGGGASRCLRATSTIAPR